MARAPLREYPLERRHRLRSKRVPEANSVSHRRQFRSSLSLLLTSIPFKHSRNLLDLYADACIPVNRGDNLVFHSKRTDEFFESPEFVERARKLVEKDKVSRLQIGR